MLFRSLKFEPQSYLVASDFFFLLLSDIFYFALMEVADIFLKIAFIVVALRGVRGSDHSKTRMKQKEEYEDWIKARQE